MPKDLQLIRRREAVELQHDRRIKRCDITMPDVARYTGEKDVGITAFECAWHRQFGNGMALPKIFAQKQRVDTRSVAADDYVLIIIRKNLRLNEVTLAQQVR